jgi:hypothetical protein
MEVKFTPKQYVFDDIYNFVVPIVSICIHIGSQNLKWSTQYLDLKFKF